MKYCCKPGIVYCKICGDSYLITVRTESNQEPNVIRLSIFSAMVWKAIENGKPFDDIYKVLTVLTHSKNQAIKTVNTIIDEFKTKDLIIPVE